MITTIKNLLRPIIPAWMLNIYHLKMGILAVFWYGLPSRKIKVIGITGTNGKTTTAHLVNSIFKKAGYKTAVATTIDFEIAGKTQKNNNKMTTMSPFAMQKFLREAKNAGCKVAIIEVTSHALLQHRLWGIKFDTVALTNITHDHLDYHKNFNEYKYAKMLLFVNNPRVSVVNLDDPSAPDFAKLKASKKYLYSVNSKSIRDNSGSNSGLIGELYTRKIIASPREVMFTAVTPIGEVVIDNQLPGKFNISNSLCAVGVALGSDIALETIRDGIEEIKLVRGRMEKVDEGQNFTVIIDYAHTPDAFEKVFDAIAPIVRARVITVHGATGARDKTKRPILGTISARHSDILIITNEDPYHEPPMTIMEEVKKGIPVSSRAKPRDPSISVGMTKSANYKVLNETLFLIEDRRLAIRTALELAEPRDVVLILGKGAEEVMAVADPKADHGYKLIPWNEREIVKEELNKVLRSK